MSDTVVRSPLAAHARTLRLARARLDKHFPEGLFPDPHLEILLDLFITAEEGRCLQVSAVSTAVGFQASGAE